MSVLYDIHQQVFSKHWVILQQFYGFVWVCAVLFKIISFGKVVNFCWKATFYTLKHVKISKVFSKKYIKFGFVGIVNTHLNCSWYFIIDFATQRFQFSIKGYEYFPPNIINCVLIFAWQHLLLVSSHSWQNVCRLGQIPYNVNISCSFVLSTHP